jgi:hypothetical protein
MRRVSWAFLVWTALGIVGIWASDAASHATGSGPGQSAVIRTPAWILFEVWAIGFVLLGSIWNGALAPVRTTSNHLGIQEQPIRRITWAVLAWTVLWIALFGIWALDPDPSIVGQGPGSGGPLHLKPPDWALFDFWLIGFFVLGAFWLIARLRTALHRRAPSR